MPDAFVRLERWILVAVVLVAATVFWRGTSEPINLTRATLVAIAAIALAAVAASRALLVGRVHLPDRTVAMAVGAFAAATLVALFVADDRAQALVGPYSRYTGAAMYLSYAVLLVFVVAAHDRASVRQLAWAGVAALTVVVGYGLLQVAGADPFEWRTTLSTDFSTLGQVNFAAGFVAVCLPFALWLAARPGDGLVRLAGLALAVASVGYAAATRSFQGPVALAAALAVFGGVLAFEHRHRVVARTQRLLVGGLAAAAVVALVLSWSTIDRNLESGLHERRLMWETAGDLFSDSPLWGHGFGSYARLFPQHRPAEHAALAGPGTVDAPHNVLLDLLTSGGVLLAGTYVLVVALVGWRLVVGLRRSEGDQRLLLAAFGAAWVAYHVQSLVSIDVPPLAVLHWTIAGAIIVLSRGDAAPEATVAGAGRPRRRSSQPSGAAVAGVAAIVVVAAVGAWVATRPLRADFAAARGRDAAGVGDLGTALARLDDATRLAPWEGNYHASRAVMLQQAGRNEEAVMAGLRAAELSPGSPQYALDSARLADAIGLPELARQAAELAVEAAPGTPEVLLEAGGLALDRGEPSLAIEHAEAALAVRRDWVPAMILRGWALAGDGREGAAVEQFRAVLALEPGNGEATRALAQLAPES